MEKILALSIISAIMEQKPCNIMQHIRGAAIMKAPKLRKGMTIGVFSPSTGISAIVPERYERGIRYLESP